MTNYDDNLANSKHDAELSAQYRAFATETTPKELDTIVLRAAVKATKRRSSGWSTSWYRPVTVIATVGLGVALILELSQPQSFAPPPDIAPGASVFQDAAENAAISVRESDATADESLQLSKQGSSGTEAITATKSATVEDQQCNDEQLVRPEAWWQCIQELREAGHPGAAESELANLHKTFPRYVPAK